MGVHVCNQNVLGGASSLHALATDVDEGSSQPRVHVLTCTPRSRDPMISLPWKNIAEVVLERSKTVTTK